MAVPGWLVAHTPLAWWERYAQRASGYRFDGAVDDQ
jgi:hypothetical protein